MDRPSPTICSWTLGSGTIHMAVNSDPFATFSLRYLFFLARDPGRPVVCGEEEGHFFCRAPCRIQERRLG
jgi:hypothetical protein